MALPVGVETFALNFGKVSDFAGVSMSRDIRIVPSHEAVWAATGEALNPAEITASAPAGEFGSIDLVKPGQAGIVDLKGNVLTNWWYTVYGTDSKSGRATSKTPKVWKLQPTVDQDIVDLELVPTDGTVGPVGSVPPPPVTSVNGQTGSVVIEAATNSGVAAFVTEDGPTKEALAGTIGAVVAPAVAPVSARVTTAERLIRVGGGSPPVDKQTAVIVGDSIISQNSSQYNTAGATQRVNNAAGWFNHAQVLLGHRFRLLKNAGMSGQTSAQILARFATDVTALAPGFAIFGGPTNDVTAIATASLTFTQVKDNYEDMWDACDAAGIRVIQCVATPRNATSGTAHRAALFQVNQWLREQARNRPKFVLIDWYAELASGTLVDWKTGYIAGTDASGLHPNPRGAYEMGRIFAERVAPLTAAVDILPNSESELANLVNVTTGAALAKGTTGIVGAGGTGQVATGWRVDPLPTASFVASKVARTDGLPGEWQQVTVNSGTVKIGVNVTGYGTTYTENDEIYAVAEYQLDPGMTAGNGKYVRLNLIAMKPDFGVGRQSIDMDVPSIVESAGSDYFPSSGVMVTPPVVVPNTATLRMALQFEVNGAATVRVGRIGMYKVGTGPGSDAWARSDAPLS